MPKSAKLIINGDIGSNPLAAMFTGENGITLKDVNNFLSENSKAEVIEIDLTTRGGDVDEGYAIREALITSGKTIKITAIGYVYSIGSVIMGAAKKENTFITKGTDYLIHFPTIGGVSGTAEEVINTGEYLMKVQDKLAETISNDTGIDIQIVKDLMRKNEPMSGEDAVNLGLIGNLIDTTIKNEYKLKAVAYFKSNKNNMESEILNEIKSALKQIKDVFVKSEPGIKNMAFIDVNGVEFTVEREDENISVGDKGSPDGTYTLESGKVITIAGGLVTEVKDPETETETELENLKKENEDLKAKLAELEGSKDELKKQVDDLNSKVESVKDLETKLKSIESKYTVEIANFQKKEMPEGITDIQAAKEAIKNKRK